MNQLLDVLTREGVLIDVSVRYWRATTKLTVADLGLDPDHVDNQLIALGHKKLIPKDALRPFATLESRAHALVEQHSFPFLNRLGHFLPNANLESVMPQLERMEQEFTQATHAFIEQYAVTRVEAVQTWQTAAAQLVSDPAHFMARLRAAFPDGSVLPERFRFSTQLFQVQVPEELDTRCVALKDQQAVMEARQGAVSRARQKISHDVEHFVGECVASLRSQVVTACEDLLTTMQDGKTGVHQKSLNRLNRFIDAFKSLNFTGDADMEAQLEQLRSTYLATPAAAYRDDATARAALQSGVQALAATAKSMVAQDTAALVDRFGELGKRKFHLVA